jgi:hypothetical protein
MLIGSVYDKVGLCSCTKFKAPSQWPVLRGVQRIGMGTVVSLHTSVEMTQLKRDKRTFHQYGAACPDWLRLELNLLNVNSITTVKVMFGRGTAFCNDYDGKTKGGLLPRTFCYKYIFVAFEVLAAVAMKSSVFWDITPCSLLKVNRGFGGIYRFHFEG